MRRRARCVRLLGHQVLGAAFVALLLSAPPAAWGVPLHPSVPSNTGRGFTAEELRAGPFLTDPSGHAPVVDSGAQRLGPVPAAASIYFTVSFDPANASALARLIQHQETPGDPLFHHFLTEQEFLDEFGPPSGIAAETIGYLSSFGATYIPSGSPFTLEFRASASSLEAAFGTPIDLYRAPNGTVGFANSRTLSLPAAIGPYVSSVDGLTSFAMARPMHLPAPAWTAPTEAGPPAIGMGSAVNMSRPANWSDPGFLYAPPGPIQNSSYQFLTPASPTIAYNASPLYALHDTGQGSTIAIVMSSGYNPSDLSTYAREAFGNASQILNRLTAFPVAGETENASAPGTHFLTDSDAMEFAIDIEYSATMAPGARLEAVYGPSLSLASLVSDYARIASLQPVPNIVTNSWGAFEDTWWNLDGPSWQSARALQNYWAELTALGSTILASSGDSGGYDALTGELSASLPASSPYVTAVGGTRTTVGDQHGNAFPSPASYAVDQTVAQFGWSQAQSGPAWFLNASLQGSDVSAVVSEGYWYASPGGGGPDYASGGLGLSQWFTQPWWQHGLSVPDSGRRMVPDISAEADFNETVYFAGAWSFFWGGTSFACPTVAGEIALLDTRLNATLGPTLGRTSYYLGGLDPVLYSLGNDLNLSGREYSPIGSGSSPWDVSEISQNLTWPPGQNWPLQSMAASAPGVPGWNLLVGWGVPDIATLAADVPAVLSPTLALRLANGTTPASAQAGTNYTLTVVNASSGAPVPNARIQLWIENASLVPYSPWQQSLVASASGTIQYDATNPAYVAFFLESATLSAFQSVWFYPAPLAVGTLQVAIVDSPPSVMGGFSGFNGFGSASYPATGPIEPNVALVRVTYRATPSGPQLPVYDAEVVATAPVPETFSSPPRYPNAQYNLTPLDASSAASLSLTNLTGVALLDTWNVPAPERYLIAATYRGLNATSAYLVTPQLNIEGVGAAERYDAAQYGGLPGYVGLGARNTILAPAVLGGDSYLLPVRVSDWTGQPVADAAIDLASPVYFGPPNMALPIPGTATRTNATGDAEFTVDSSVSQFASLFGGNLSVQVFNSSYPSAFVNTSVGSLPLRTNDSDATLHFLAPASTVIRIGSFGGAITTDYVGTTGAVAMFTVSSEAPVAGRFNNITAISYALDTGAPVSVPLGSAGQNTYSWQVDLPTLALGSHNFSVTFADAQGFTYPDTHEFWVIGPGPYPAPVVTFASPPSSTYAGGTLLVSWTSDQTPYLRSETLWAASDGLVANYNVTGTSSFNLSLDGFASRTLVLRLDAENVNGLNGSATTVVYVTHQFLPAVEISMPSNGSLISAGTNVTVIFGYSGDYLRTATLSVRLPNGTLIQADVAGKNSYTLGAVVPGNYTLSLAVTSSDGASASTLEYFSVYLPEVITSVHLSPTNAIVGVGGLVQFTASATCAPVACPDWMIFSWSTLSSTIGSLTSGNGRSVEFLAGQLVGTTVVVVNATLPTGTVSAVGLITVSSTAVTSSEPPVYANPYLWAGVVLVIGLLCALILVRVTRVRTPEPPAVRSGPEGETDLDPGASPPADPVDPGSG